jgi:hypothetical protein
MTDGVVFADIIMVANDLAVVRIPYESGGILGVCRMPSAAVMPADTWFSAIDGKSLPLIAHLGDQGLIVEALIAGKPLMVTFMGATGSQALSLEDYPWTSWNRCSGHASWTFHLAQGTHFLVGVMVVALLLVVISTRRQASREPVRPGSAVTMRTVLRSACGGMLGLGKDSFTRFPPPKGDDGMAAS